MHNPCEVRSGGFRKQMIMVAHENKGIKIKAILLFTTEHIVHKLQVIIVTDKYFLTAITPAGDMI